MAMFLRKEKNSVRATEVKRGKREMRPSRLLSSRFNSKRALLSSTMTPYQEFRGVGVFQLVSCFLRTNRDRVMRSGSSRTHTNIAHQDKKISLGGCVVCPLERIIDSSQLAPTDRYETHSNTNKQQQQALVRTLTMNKPKLFLLPSDAHSVIYSFLKWHEKRIFISLSREIYFNSRSYREIKFNRTFSEEFAFNESFRERVCELIFPHHVQLNLSRCKGLTDEALIHLGDVQSLDLYDCRITDEGVRHLGSVHTLNLGSCTQLTDEGICYLGNVHTLDLRSCDQLTDEGIRHLGNVKNLNLSRCRYITDQGIRHLGNVHTLHLSNCPQITDEGVRHLGQVTDLDLYSCPLVTDEGLRHLGGVHSLQLSHCPITDEGLRHLGSVNSLSCFYCDQITDNCLPSLVHVQELFLLACRGLIGFNFRRSHQR
jgi:hypothetical protein